MNFTEEFFQKEIREGFEVPEMMKRAWAAQIEVLQIVIDICEKKSITVFCRLGNLVRSCAASGIYTMG